MERRDRIQSRAVGKSLECIGCYRLAMGNRSPEPAVILAVSLEAVGNDGPGNQEIEGKGEKSWEQFTRGARFIG